MQTIQHATNLPYIPQYTMWNYAMEHPVLFFMMVCFIMFVIYETFNDVVYNLYLIFASIVDYIVNNKIIKRK